MTNNYTAKIYSDVSFFDEYGAIHTWIELTDDQGNKSVYSYNPAKEPMLLEAVKSLNSPVQGAFNKTDEPEGRKESSVKTTRILTKQQYDIMKSTGDALKRRAEKGELDYALLQDGAPNCVQLTSDILKSGGIELLDGIVDPRMSADLLEYLNTNGEHSLDDPAVLEKIKNQLMGRLEGPYSPSLSIGAFNAVMSAKTPYSLAQAVFTPPPRVDPIAIDMDGDGVETLSQTDGAYFDLDKNGFAEKTGWVKGDDALLVRDLNNDGKINDGGELFGDQTVLSTGIKATTGFEALAELDSNKDGKISVEDVSFNTLKVWKDSDSDGVTDEGELTSLAEAGIKSISLNAQTVNGTDGLGNTIASNSSVEFEDGRINTASEFLFNRNTIDTVVSNQQVVADDIKILPFMRGFGNSADLHTAMSQDAVLKEMVEEFVTTKDTNIAFELSEKFEAVLFKWFGVDAVASDSRGPNIDARRLGVLEKLKKGIEKLRYK